jgi:hypothetical protein
MDVCYGGWEGGGMCHVIRVLVSDVFDCVGCVEG